MPLTIVDGPTIAAGESLSDGADCSAGTIVRITVPQEFTPANLTFQVSSDGNFYNDLFNSNGEEITVVAKPQHRHRRPRGLDQIDQLHQVQIGHARLSGRGRRSNANLR